MVLLKQGVMLVVLCLLLLLSHPVQSQLGSDQPLVRVSLSRLPLLAEENMSGVLVELVQAIDSELGTTSEIIITPFARAMMKLEKGDIDFHMPSVKLRNSSDYPFVYSTHTKLFKVDFSLYTHKDSKIDLINIRSEIKEGGAIIYTEKAHVKLFDFSVKGDSCIDCILRMVDKGRVDGFIFASFESDSIVDKYNLKNVQKNFFSSYPVHVIFPDKNRADKYDLLLFEAIERLKEKGIYQKIMGRLIDTYK